MNESLFALPKDVKSLDRAPSLETGNNKLADIGDKELIDRIVIKSGGRIYFLKVDEIDWVEGLGDYLSLHAGSLSHLIRETMTVFQPKLNSKKF